MIKSQKPRGLRTKLMLITPEVTEELVGSRLSHDGELLKLEGRLKYLVVERFL
jgi:hypothetical protein